MSWSMGSIDCTAVKIDNDYVEALKKDIEEYHANPKMLEEMGIDKSESNPRLRNFLDLLYYNLKYRHYTQQSLELMIESFFCGYSVKT